MNTIIDVVFKNPLWTHPSFRANDDSLEQKVMALHDTLVPHEAHLQVVKHRDQLMQLITEINEAVSMKGCLPAELNDRMSKVIKDSPNR